MLYTGSFFNTIYKIEKGCRWSQVIPTVYILVRTILQARALIKVCEYKQSGVGVLMKILAEIAIEIIQTRAFCTRIYVKNNQRVQFKSQKKQVRNH